MESHEVDAISEEVGAFLVGLIERNPNVWAPAVLKIVAAALADTVAQASGYDSALCRSPSEFFSDRLLFACSEGSKTAIPQGERH